MADAQISGAGDIASVEVVSQPGINVSITGAGNIASAEAFGLASVSVPVSITGAGNIASAEAFGQPELYLFNVAPAGVQSYAGIYLESRATLPGKRRTKRFYNL